MRKITREASEAFNSGSYYNKGNTKVDMDTRIDNDENDMYETEYMLYLHGHKIAWKVDYCGPLYFSMCGWPSVTTRERLKGVGIRISQRRGKQYLLRGDNTIVREIDPHATYLIGNDDTCVMVGELTTRQ